MANDHVLDFSLRKDSDRDSVSSEGHEDQQTQQPHNEQVVAMEGDSQLPRRKRLQRMRQNDEKLMAIERIKRGESKAAVSRAMGIPESTIRGWVKMEARIRGVSELRSSCDSETTSSDEDKRQQQAQTMEQVGKRYRSEEIPVTPSESPESTTSSSSGVEEAARALLTMHSQEPSLVGPQVLASLEDGWNWLMYNQQRLRQQARSTMIPHGIVCETPSPQQLDGPKNMSEAIAYGEKFVEWLEKSEHPAVTVFKVMQMKQLILRLKKSQQ